MNLPPIHLAVMQPAGYVHALGFLDQARYLRWQFRRLGAEVSLARNRLRADAVNVVFGAHLGFPDDARQRHTCIFVNLEQIGQGGAQLDPAYLRLLARSAVVDYDPANVAVYAEHPEDVPLVPFLHAPYLETQAPLPLAERPIDLLFFGSMNARRQAWLGRVEACGLTVSTFDAPLYCEERDHYIRQARAVLNCHYYDSGRFEQVRASHCLSLGTPVISERLPGSAPGAAFEDAVFWLGDDQLEAFFRHQFARPAFFAEAERKLAAFRQHDALEAYADLLAFACGYHQALQQTSAPRVWQPRRINLGSGKDYRPGWLNLDILERTQPDLVLDLAQPQDFPLERRGSLGATIRLEPASVDLVRADNVLEHVPDLPTLLGNVLALLRDGGEFHVDVPYEQARSAWQDPTHVRAFNENSWLYPTEWFWYLGWFEWRFHLVSLEWLDARVQPCAQPQAAFMRVVLRKQATTPRERMTARSFQADFGGVPDDLPPVSRPIDAAPPARNVATAQG